MDILKKLSRSTMAIALGLGLLTACDPEEVVEETKARFNAVQDATDPLTYNFENVSEGVNNTYAWDFGDGNTSTDVSPTHTFAAEGTYTVTLTATGDNGSGTLEQVLNVEDPNQALKRLTGETSKTWKLVREANAMWVGPADFSQTWWAIGPDAPAKPYERACLYNDEWIFSLSGSMEYNANGDVYADGGVWAEPPAPGCVDVTDANAFSGVDGDLSAWGSGTHTFEFDAENSTLRVIGTGAFVALPKAIMGSEVTTPQSEVTYNVLSLVDADVDTLVLQTDLTEAGGAWVFTLVSYDNPADEPELGTGGGGGTEKPLESNDIFDNFSDDGNSNLTWSNAEITGWSVGDANPDAGETFAVATYEKGGGTTENVRAELAFRMDLSTRNQFSVKAYVPSSNDYTTVDPAPESWSTVNTLQKTVTLRFYDSTDGQPWNSQAQVVHTVADADLDVWVDINFDFSSAAAATIYDIVIFQLGGEGHHQPGTFYLSDFQLNAN